MLRLGCKAVGLAAFMFCAGMISGFLLPVCVVAVIETVLLMLIAYYCLFKF